MSDYVRSPNRAPRIGLAVACEKCKSAANAGRGWRTMMWWLGHCAALLAAIVIAGVMLIGLTPQT